MKRFGVFGGILLALFAASGMAGEYGQHYVSLSAGLDAGAMKAPGFEAAVRVFSHYSSRWRGSDGGNGYYKREVFYVEPELTWSSGNETVFGARYAASMALPSLYHVEDMRKRDDVQSREHITLKTGDLRITPLTLGWDRGDCEVLLGYTVFAPTGQHDFKTPRPGKPVRPSGGKGYWTHMFNLGGAYYLDAGRTWTATVMAHYELHGRQDGTKVRFGDTFHIEYGVGKDFRNGFRLGLIGYASVQTRDNSPGMKRSDPRYAHIAYLENGAGNRVFGTGLEIGYESRFRGRLWFATARSAVEYGAKGAMRGWRNALDLGVRF
ncbi:MAG: transporter [Planctomycetota bacterium]|jgi:hypothetical protein|nr:transporter [Planctomycetota bacterium]